MSDVPASSSSSSSTQIRTDVIPHTTPTHGNTPHHHPRYASSIPWSHLDSWNCNRKVNPTSGATHYDGGSLDPLEAMFVKVKAAQGAAPWVRKARAYERWGLEEGLGEGRSVSGVWFVVVVGSQLCGGGGEGGWTIV